MSASSLSASYRIVLVYAYIKFAILAIIRKRNDCDEWRGGTIICTVTHISTSCFEQLLQYSLSELPNEACGLLLANSEGCTITEMQPITNCHEAAKLAFRFDAKQWVQQYFAAIQRNQRVAGIFHSHPSGDAIPSQEDMDGFLDQQMIYAIISLKQKDSPKLQFYRYNAKNRFIDHPLMLT